jgi:hypothetical protein
MGKCLKCKTKQAKPNNPLFWCEGCYPHHIFLCHSRPSNTYFLLTSKGVEKALRRLAISDSFVVLHQIKTDNLKVGLERLHREFANRRMFFSSHFSILSEKGGEYNIIDDQVYYFFDFTQSDIGYIKKITEIKDGAFYFKNDVMRPNA